MKKYILSILILAIMVIVYSCKEDDDNDDKVPEVELSGIITDSQDLPVPFVEIEFYEENPTTQKAKTGLLSDKFIGSDTTDEDGNFSISIPENENVYAVIQHEDFQNKKYKIKDLLKSGTKTFLKGDRKEECQSTLSIQVQESKEGNETNPLFEAKILIYRENKLIRKSFTNQDGVFKFEEMCPGDYQIKAIYKNIESEKVELKIDDPKDYSYAFTMQMEEEKDSCCEGIMKFYPKDKDGNVIEGARVILYKDGKAIEDPEVKDGKAVVDGICEGKYTVVFKKDGYETMEFQVEIGCNKEIEVTKTMTAKEEDCCDATLDMYLLNKNQEKANGTVILKKAGQDNKSKKSENGKVSFADLCEGKYTIVIESEDYERMEFTYEVKCHDSLTITKTLTPNEKDTCCDGFMKFYPKDKDGNTLNGAKILLYKDGKAIKDKIVNDGKAVIEDICEGKYTVVIKKEGYEDIEFNIEIDCNKTIEIEKTMTKKEEDCCDATLDMYLLNKNQEKANGTVILKKEGQDNKSKKSENGKVSFADLCEGKYTIVIESEDYERMEFTYEIKCHDSLTITKTLTPNEKDTCCDGIMKFYPKDKDGNVIEGARVILYKDGKAIEDPEVKDGKAVVDGICEGKYTVVFKKDGYETMEFQVEIGCNKEIEVTKTMTAKEEDCCDATLDMYLLNKNQEKANGTVILKKEGQDNKSKKSENGKVSFADLCEGKYTIVIESEDYERMEFTYEIKCHDSLSITKTLTPNEEDSCCDGIMKFYPKDKDGNIINGAKILLYKNGKAIKDKIVTDGKAVIEDICEGKYTVVIKKEGYEDIEFNIEIDCNKTIEIEKTMTKKEEDCCDATLDMYLLNKNQEKANGTVILKKEGQDNKSKKSENGKVSFADLCEGKYTIVIESEDYERMEFTYEIKCHDSLSITKTLTPNEKDTCCDATIKIYVKDEQGKYVEGADVEYWLDGKKVAEGKTNVDGHFMAEDLCKGKYTIVIKKDGYKSTEIPWEIKECKVYQETFKLKK